MFRYLLHLILLITNGFLYHPNWVVIAKEALFFFTSMHFEEIFTFADYFHSRLHWFWGELINPRSPNIPAAISFVTCISCPLGAQEGLILHSMSQGLHSASNKISKPKSSKLLAFYLISAERIASKHILLILSLSEPVLTFCYSLRNCKN